MNRRNEGYTLPLVLIVMVILCLVAVSIMSVSLNNLQKQKAYIERMEDQYAAQGKIEQTVSFITQEIKRIDLNDSSLTVASARGKIDIAIKKAAKDILGIDDVSVNWNTTEEADSTCTVTLQADQGSVRVTCTIELKDVVTLKQSKVSVNTEGITYTSYSIDMIEETIPESSETGVTEP